MLRKLIVDRNLNLFLPFLNNSVAHQQLTAADLVGGYKKKNHG